MTMLTKQEKELVDEIMRRESPQNKVDEIVTKTKEAMEIYESERYQARVDKIVRMALEKLNQQDR